VAEPEAVDAGSAALSDIFFDMGAMTAADLLATARRHAGISQAMLASRAGSTQAHISRIERGLTSPTTATLGGLLNACDAELELGWAPRRGVADDDELRRFRALTPAERLTDAFSASVFASRLRGQDAR